MRHVTRDDLVDYQTYIDDVRDVLRPEVFAAKRLRRIHIGDTLTLLFENPLTVRYQVQEMMRTERIVKEADIHHELETYNELLGGDGELGITLLIEIDDAGGRDEKLGRWLALNKTLYVELEDGTRVPPEWDPRQVGETRLSSVQYLRFDTGGKTPVAVGCAFDDPVVFGRTVLTDDQRAALAADLADT